MSEPINPAMFTERMRQVLQGIFEGKTNIEIGRDLNISPKTIEKHRAGLYGVFAVDNAVSLVVAALRAKVISL